jgi:hypothetical protein
VLGSPGRTEGKHGCAGSGDWCNGSPYQQWQASEANGNPRSLQWRNVASRGWIQANATGQQLSTSTAAKRPAGAFWAWNTPGQAQG